MIGNGFFFSGFVSGKTQFYRAQTLIAVLRFDIEVHNVERQNVE
jgi:hypothetical protein